MELNRMTCSVQVLIAARDCVLYSEKIREALELASSTEAPVTTCDFYTITGKKTDVIDCCGFMVFNELFNDMEVDKLGNFFSALICKMLGKYPVLSEQKVLFLHHSEMELIETMCDSFGVDIGEMLDFSNGEETSPYSFFSFHHDFVKSRHRRIVNERVMQHILSTH